MKKWLALFVVTALWGSVAGFLFVRRAQAQIDAFTFYIPYATEILDDQFDVGHNGLILIDDDIQTNISIAMHRDQTIVHYDHWEDGLEPNLAAPVQATTEIWGDNDPANGIPPGFGQDLLNANDVITLLNLVALPRDNSVLFFDGGDALTSLGGATAVTVAVWPSHGKPKVEVLYAGAWELYPTNRWGLSYRAPVGEDLSILPPPLRRLGFSVVGLNIQAAKNNTTVNLDLDADNNFETVINLNRGEQFTAIQGVHVGAQIEADDPVQVHLFTANPDSVYEARAYSLIPVDQWTGDLLAPRSSDGDFWIYNPGDSTLNVTASTITTTTVLAIPANSTARFPKTGLSQATGARFTSTDGRPLFGVAALDLDDAQDWGYALHPVNRLDTQTLIGYGPGNKRSNPKSDESRVYVTALSPTTILVDYDNDGVTDGSFPVTPLAEVPITDPFDHDLTGAFLFTDDDTPFIAVWGQDQSASPALPSIDIGTSIVPLPSLLVQKTVIQQLTDPDCTGSITGGDTVRYQLEYFNNSVNTINNVIIEDDVPTTLTYVPNSTVVDGVPVQDDLSGSGPFPFDEGGFPLGNVPARGSGSLTYDMIISQPTDVVVNAASIRSESLSIPADFVLAFEVLPTNPTPLYTFNGDFSDANNDGHIQKGEEVIAAITISNTGNTNIKRLPVLLEFNSQHLTLLNVQPAPDVRTAGSLSWTDLTRILGNLRVGQTLDLRLRFLVSNAIPDTIQETGLTLSSTGGVLRDDRLLPSCDGVALITFSTPTPTPTMTPTPPTGTPPTVTATPPTGTPPTVTATPPTGTPPTLTSTPPTGTPPTVTSTPPGGSSTPTPTPPSEIPGGTPTTTPTSESFPPAIPTPGADGRPGRDPLPTPSEPDSFIPPGLDQPTLPDGTPFPAILLPETGYRPAQYLSQAGLYGLGIVVISGLGLGWRLYRRKE